VASARRLLLAVPTALVLGGLAIAFNIAFAAIIYRGELAPFVDRGIALTLLGAAPMAAVGALVLSYRGSVCQPQDTPAIVLSIAAAGIAARTPDPSSERSFATVAALVVIAAAGSGLFAWALGRLRLGFVARFIPFPVVAGFLAATGYLLVMAALGMTVHAPVDVWSLGVLLAPGNPERWLPWALLGGATTLLMRRIESFLVLPLSLLAAGVGFYLAIPLLDVSLDEARKLGLLIGPFSSGGFLGALRDWQPLAIDWPAIVAEAPSILTAIGLASAAALLSASALEVATQSQVDPDHDLRGIGLCNLASAAGGGPIGYHVLAETLAAHRMGSDGPANGLFVAAACLVALMFGAGAIASLPVGLVSMLIVAVGLAMLLGVLVDQRRSLPATDYAVALIIPAVTAAFGFLWGVAVGLLAAALFFIVTFARIDVVRLESTGARMRSHIERPEADEARLTGLGLQSLIYVLAGFLFFGTAHRLVHRVQTALARNPRPRFVLVDFRRVRGIDTSAARALTRLDEACRAEGVKLWLTGLDPASARLVRGQAGNPGLAIAASLELALEEVETALLAESPAAAAAPGILEAFRRRHPALDRGGYLQAVSVPAGGEVIAQGAPSDFLIILRSGLLRTEVLVPGAPPMTVARCLPGALVGEIGLYAGVPRTARVVAEEASEILRIDKAALERMGRDHPLMLADFHRLIATVLARRLSRTTALLADSEIQAR
jgi:SulP family sulfate permease